MYKKLEKFLSKERLNAYCDKFGAECNAFNCYEANIIISHSIFVALQFVEIGLRNKVNDALVKEFGNEWYLDCGLLSGDNMEKGVVTIQKIIDVKLRIEERKKEKKVELIVTNADIVAGLDFGFWTNMFCGNYEGNIWSKCLKYEFNGFKRKDLFGKLNKIRYIRNRIFHHEPIFIKEFASKDGIGEPLFEILNYIYGKELCEYIFKLSDMERFWFRFEEALKQNEKDPSTPLNQ